jgi:hypothetical protein
MLQSNAGLGTIVLKLKQKFEPDGVSLVKIRT